MRTLRSVGVLPELIAVIDSYCGGMRLIIAGGSGGVMQQFNGQFKHLVSYDPSTDTWENLTTGNGSLCPLPAAIEEHEMLDLRATSVMWYDEAEYKSRSAAPAGLSTAADPSDDPPLRHPHTEYSGHPLLLLFGSDNEPVIWVLDYQKYFCQTGLRAAALADSAGHKPVTSVDMWKVVRAHSRSPGMPMIQTPYSFQLLAFGGSMPPRKKYNAFVPHPRPTGVYHSRIHRLFIKAPTIKQAEQQQSGADDNSWYPIELKPHQKSVPHPIERHRARSEAVFVRDFSIKPNGSGSVFVFSTDAQSDAGVAGMLHVWDVSEQEWRTDLHTSPRRLYPLVVLSDFAVTEQTVVLPPLPAKSKQSGGSGSGGGGGETRFGTKIWMIGGHHLIHHSSSLVSSLTIPAGWSHSKPQPELKWTAEPELNVKRQCARAAVINEQLIVMGGRKYIHQAMEELASVERFNPAKNAWELISPMPVARHSFVCWSVDDI